MDDILKNPLMNNPDTVTAHLLREMGKNYERYKNHDQCLSECKTYKALNLYVTQKYFPNYKTEDSVVSSIQKIVPIDLKTK